jgi:hypothetical protein
VAWSAYSASAPATTLSFPQNPDTRLTPGTLANGP